MLHATPLVDLELHDSIKRRLRARNITFSSIAAEAGCSVSTVTMVSQGYRRNVRVEDLISEALGLSPQALWPHRYPEHGRKDQETMI